MIIKSQLHLLGREGCGRSNEAIMNLVSRNKLLNGHSQAGTHIIPPSTFTVLVHVTGQLAWNKEGRVR